MQKNPSGENLLDQLQKLHAQYRAMCTFRESGKTKFTAKDQ